MAKTVHEQIEWLVKKVQNSEVLINAAIKGGDYDKIHWNGNILARHHLKMGLLRWRRGQDPSLNFSAMVKIIHDLAPMLAEMNPEVNPASLLPWRESIYVASLVGLKISPVDYADQDEHTMSAAYFGNVLLGVENVLDWPKYRDLEPRGSRYELAKRIHNLFADLLAGNISHQDGVVIGERLWSERKDDPYFDVGTAGYGLANETMVDYQLGAILKKIGSTVPTVHAWRW